jgi:hypothetical protein
MRLAIAAFFVALIAIPVAQVAKDTRADGGRLYIWNGHLRPDTVALSKHQRSKGLDNLLVPRPQNRKKTG